MKSKLFLLLTLSAFVLGACAKGGTSDQSSVVPAPSSETTSTSESSAPSSESSSEEERVTELNVSGVIAPVAGETTSISGLTIDEEDATIDYDACWWFYLSNEDEYIFAEADQSKAFEQGTQYGIKIAFELHNKVFDDDVEAYIKIDDSLLEPDRVQPYENNKKANAYFYFDTLPGPRPLHKIAVVNRPTPVVGEVAPVPSDFIAVEPAACLRVDSANTYWTYYPYGETAYLFSRGNDSSKVFEAGIKYGLLINLEPRDRDKYEFADDLEVLVMGVPTEFTYVGEHDDVALEIIFGVL